MLLPASRSGALTLLTADKHAVFLASSRTGGPSATVHVGRDRALRDVSDAGCPTRSSLRFALSRRAADFENHGEIVLPCEGWSREGMRQHWRGAAGGIRDVVVGPRGLLVRARGAEFRPVTGPVAYVEAWLTIGVQTYLVRFHTFRQNDAAGIVTRRASSPGAAGEAAFWDTLWADAPRSDEALGLLTKAVRREPRDGRSQFLLGMLHLYRSGKPPFDFGAPSDAARAEIHAAREPLDRAVELLPEDTRVPGFRAAATYADAFVHGDAATTALGLQQLDQAIAVNALFDAFDLFAVVAPNVAGSDPFFQSRVLPLVDVVLIDNSRCPFTLPEICNNAGMAPHNIEGTLVLLGDLYVKGGRLEDALQWYTIASGFGGADGYRYQDIIDDRLANAETRAALYADADPTNDPPILGGGGAACIYCHNK